MPNTSRIDMKFYGRRKGRPLRVQAQAAMKNDAYHVVPSNIGADLQALFPHPVRDVQLEIGFGGGEHLCMAAHTQPDIGFIGAEVFLNGYAQAAARAGKLGLANLRLFHGDARDLLALLPAGGLDAICLLYPDPWPKRRHWKRRFVSHANLVALARVLKPGGVLRFATDWADYAAWTLMHIQQSPLFLWSAISYRDWQTPDYPWTETRYEQKARKEGRETSYLTFIRA